MVILSLEDIYSEIILDYAKNTKNKRIIEDAHEKKGKNLSCGDEIKIFIKPENGIIKDVSFEGHGCIISQASAAIMCDTIKGKTVEEAEDFIEEVLKMARGEDFDKEKLGELDLFENIKDFPMRIKCFTLSWHTAKEDIEEIKEG
ncbi:Fe-S cluster assembly sulfur transfer protein SufU [Geotoga petraea]|jgi:nitrogen fixation NifU-like protein|uniref:SUF system NifU family Fe-S cluster assembly protein n=1 Tax=Geotoga petraea TaxID=28234 RepID=A0A4Z0W2J0_9BACT|nr:SUF system NifU family Fe-S cluster assembly protein [Geotoga petraea]TGG87490.1 SUF system NifU family Fe-S cluster assembly protein [Geotoga petraea]